MSNTEQMIAEATHPIYPRATPETADGVAWVFYDKNTFAKYYYKLPEVGPTDVRIRALYAGLCHSDVMSGREKWGSQLRPLCPGHEVAGEVVAVGKDVKSVKPGDSVLFGPTRDSCGDCSYCHEGETTLCPRTEGSEKFLYGRYFGGYASHQQQPESHCFKIPAGLNISNAAPLMCAGVTVYSPMARHLKKGQRIAVLGVGGLGHLAVQYGVKMGLTVDALMSGIKTDKKDYVKSLGVDQIHEWKTPGVLSSLKGTYDAIIYTIPVSLPRDEMDALMQTMRPRGKMIIVGFPDIAEAMTLSFASQIVNEYSIIYSCVGGRKITEEMLQFSADHKIECLCEHFGWHEFPQALDRLENGSPKFRCVVDMDQFTKDFAKKN